MENVPSSNPIPDSEIDVFKMNHVFGNKRIYALSPAQAQQGTHMDTQQRTHMDTQQRAHGE